MKEEDKKRIEEAALRNSPVEGERHFKAGAEYEHEFLKNDHKAFLEKSGLLVKAYNQAIEDVLNRLVQTLYKKNAQ
jgi:hypothetical protein